MLQNVCQISRFRWPQFSWHCYLRSGSCMRTLILHAFSLHKFGLLDKWAAEYMAIVQNVIVQGLLLFKRNWWYRSLRETSNDILLIYFNRLLSQFVVSFFPPFLCTNLPFSNLHLIKMMCFLCLICLHGFHMLFRLCVFVVTHANVYSKLYIYLVKLGSSFFLLDNLCYDRRWRKNRANLW